MKKSMFRLLALTMAVLMTCALGVMTVFAATTGVTTSKLNRRKSPSTTAAKNGTIAKGATVTITDIIYNGDTYNGKTVSGDWYKLSNGDFVSADYVELEEEEAPDEGDEFEEEEAPDEGNDLEEEIIVDGDGVTIEGEDGEISVEGDEEEVPFDEEEVPADEEEIPPDEDDPSVEEVPADEETETGTVKASSLNVRAGPSTTASSLGRLAKGKVVTITATYENGDRYNGEFTVKNKWYEIDYNGETGYVSADYVTLGGTDTTATGQKVTLSIKNTKTVYKTTQAVKAYAVPFTTGNVTKTIASGTTVTVSKTIKSGSSYTGVNAKVSGDWYMIGTKQFVQAKYVKATTSTSKSEVTFELGTKLVTTDTVNQRSRPSTSATSLGKLAKGTSFVVVGVVKEGEKYNGTTITGNWVQVKGGGFISADYVQLP